MFTAEYKYAVDWMTESYLQKTYLQLKLAGAKRIKQPSSKEKLEKASELVLNTTFKKIMSLAHWKQNMKKWEVVLNLYCTCIGL